MTGTDPTGRMLAGRCECRAVRYRVPDAFRYAGNCHCSNCRADANHTRCGICGSLLYSVVRDGAYVHVAMGSLVDDPTIRPTEHIFVGSKAPWFEITDDLPQSEEYE